MFVRNRTINFSVSYRTYNESNGLRVRKLGDKRIALGFGKRAIVFEIMVWSNGNV